MNAVEREPDPTRVLNPNASEASFKPKQRSYRKTKLKKKLFFCFYFFRGDFGRGDFVGGILSWNPLIVILEQYPAYSLSASAVDILFCSSVEIFYKMFIGIKTQGLKGSLVTILSMMFGLEH